MHKAPPVDRSTLRLSEVARHVVIPEGIVDTVWFEVEARCREFGDTFDTWQDGLGQVALGVRADGTWAATVGGITLSIPRQVAKTFIVGRVVVALCTLFPSLTVIWTAHRLRTATNTFQKLKGFCLRPAVKAHLKAGSNQGTAIRDANGEQEIPFANGSRILFGAREAGFGRGFDEVDIIVFDEAQILTEKALEDMVAATNQSRWSYGALLFYMGTPPRPIDPGEAFTGRRAEALALKGESADFSEPVAAGDAVYVECSADPSVGRPGGPSLDDLGQVEKANPSFPHRTPPIAVKRLRKNLPSDAGWRREGLGVWDDDAADAKRLIPADTWAATAVAEAPDGIRSLAITFDFDGSRQAVAGAVKHDDGIHVELVGAHSGSADLGTQALVEWLTADPARPERWRTLATIAIAGGGEAGALHKALADAGVPKQMMQVLTTPNVLAANAMLLDALRDRSLSHPAAGTDDPLEASVAVCDQKIRAGGWSWKPTVPDGDQMPIEAVSMALWAAKTTKRRPIGDRTNSASRGRVSGRGRSAGRR